MRSSGRVPKANTPQNFMQFAREFTKTRTHERYTEQSRTMGRISFRKKGSFPFARPFGRQALRKRRTSTRGLGRSDTTKETAMKMLRVGALQSGGHGSPNLDVHQRVPNEHLDPNHHLRRQRLLQETSCSPLAQKVTLSKYHPESGEHFLTQERCSPSLPERASSGDLFLFRIWRGLKLAANSRRQRCSTSFRLTQWI